MAVPAQYQFEIMSGWGDPAGMVNVETMADSDGRYFYAPALEDDFILLAPLSGGGQQERGYTSITWLSDLWRGQYKVLYATLLSNNYSGKVTMQTLRATDDSTYTIYRAYLRLSLLGEVSRNYKQYQQCKWNFTRCTLVTP